MKILVTGGAGFIGTNLCNELRSRGKNVVACDLYNTDGDDYIRCDQAYLMDRTKETDEIDRIY
jgi:dTDP-glucose 4,6-dehydratase